MRGPTVLPQERHAREVRAYRDALRAVNDIARRAVLSEGENRFLALSNINRITAAALNENP